MTKFIDRLNIKNAGMFGSAGRASLIGLHMASGIFVGCLAGFWLDEWLGTSPWLKIVFFFLGVVAGFRNVYLDVRRLLADQETGDTLRENGGKSEDNDGGPYRGQYRHPDANGGRSENNEGRPQAKS